MSWANGIIERLKNGESVEFKPKGNSMSPVINNGELVRCEPISDSTEIKKGSIVLCVVKGRQYLHFVKHIAKGVPTQYRIGNNKGRMNGFILRDKIYGICTSH